MFEADGKEFHSVAKEVFEKIIDLDDFHVLAAKLDILLMFMLLRLESRETKTFFISLQTNINA
jgi:hypothetical protein